MSKFASGWYLIYTMSQREKKVAQLLAERKIKYFLPTIKEIRLRCDRKKVIDTPLFPSYVFVNLENQEDFFTTQAVDGFCCYVRFGKQLARVDQCLIDQIDIAVCYGHNVNASAEQFLPGQKLLITYGPLSGLFCEVVKYKGTRKLVVRVGLLQRNIMMEVLPEYLDVVNDPLMLSNMEAE
ncbi:UpxY family transcription antiterminator [Chitinophaga varians]|uniref:UpxY family transcription antiterminator n=1 Tax=Chitinophaga varians TaxID=2202339 RepID=A0A847S1A1_9BACT|nr:UpxY family transcription antiterminator [Chitinophaga varians]NLR69193.1 UpxY family transcription antiterminator [Chitinophaga varians]